MGNVRMADPVLIQIEINPESRVKAVRTAHRPDLRKGNWCRFRVQIANEARTTARLRVESPQAPPQPGHRDRWMDCRLEQETPLTGAKSEFRTLLLRTNETGWREATLVFDVGQGTQDLGFRAEVSLLFRCIP